MIVTVNLYEAKDYSRELIIFSSQKGSKKTSRERISVLTRSLVPAARLRSIRGQHVYREQWYKRGHNATFYLAIVDTFPKCNFLLFGPHLWYARPSNRFVPQWCKDIWMSDVDMAIACTAWSPGTWYLRWLVSIKRLSFSVCAPVTCSRVLDGRGTDGECSLSRGREERERHNRLEKDEMCLRLQHYWAWRCSGSCKSKNRGGF